MAAGGGSGLGVREMARHLECAPSLVSRYKARGMPLASVQAARAWLAANVQPDPRSPFAGGGGATSSCDDDAGDADGYVPDYRHSRARREAAEASLAQLKLAEQRGELVRAEDVRASWARQIAALREALLQLPARVVPLLVADPQAAAMDEVLRAEIVQALAMLSAPAPQRAAD